jgi:hypothetical protein
MLDIAEQKRETGCDFDLRIQNPQEIPKTKNGEEET